MELKDVGHEDYEILPVEPLHTIAGHIKNIYQAMPCNLKILQQLCEIQEIMYAEEKDRTSKTILRFHNLTFLHALDVVPLIKIPRGMTERKLFGQYYHALISHASQQFRIINLSSCNAEAEERAFHFFKEVSKRTSNRHAEQMLFNAFIRLQVREDWEENLGSVRIERRNLISKHADLLKPDRNNTSVPFWVIEMFPRAWQAHLERISDYLDMNVWEETPDGIIFHDFDDCIKFPPPRHFRSTTMNDEYRRLKTIWLTLSDAKIPAMVKFNADGRHKKLSSLVFGDEENLSLGDEDQAVMVEQETACGEQDQDVARLTTDCTTSTPKSINKKLEVTSATTPITPLARMELTSKYNEYDTENQDMPCCSKSLPVNANEDSSEDEADPQTDQQSTIKAPTNEQEAEAKQCPRTSRSNQSKGKKKSIVLEITDPIANSKTAKHFQDILGKNDLITQYAKFKSILKAKFSEEMQNNFKDVCAQLEVLLKKREEELASQLQSLEICSFKKNTGISTVPKDEEQKLKYNSLMNKLKVIKSLKRCL